MVWTVVGILVELIGLGATVVTLARAWNGAQGSSYRFVTGDAKPVAVVRYGDSDWGSATVTLDDGPAVDDIDGRLRNLTDRILTVEADMRSVREDARRDVREVRTDLDTSTSQAAAGVRLDVRIATLGLSVAALGVLLQLIGVFATVS